MKTTKEKIYMWRDQYGYIYYAKNRKELVQAVSPYGTPRVAIMYADKKDGTTVRTGYVIGDHWCKQYEPVETVIE